MMLPAFLILLGAQAVQPVGKIEVVDVVEVSRPILSLPDVLAPALIPYVNCLMPMGRDAVPTPGRDCSAERAKASAEAQDAMKRDLSDHDRREIAQAFLLNVEVIADNVGKPK